MTRQPSICGLTRPMRRLVVRYVTGDEAHPTEVGALLRICDSWRRGVVPRAALEKFARAWLEVASVEEVEH